MAETVPLLSIEQIILQALKNKKHKQADIAELYFRAIVVMMTEEGDPDWGVINGAIIKRWSRAGLERIKEMAWKMVEQKE